MANRTGCKPLSGSGVTTYASSYDHVSSNLTLPTYIMMFKGKQPGKKVLMKYKVIIGWRCEFIFDDIDTAANFATLAMKAKCDREDGETIRIEIIPDTKEGEKKNE